MPRLSVPAVGNQRTDGQLQLQTPNLPSTFLPSQVLLAMAEELGRFIPCVGGPQRAYVLLKPLEELCTMDETLVREKATASLAEIGPQLPAQHIAEYFVPLVKVRDLPATAKGTVSRLAGAVH